MMRYPIPVCLLFLVETEHILPYKGMSVLYPLRLPLEACLEKSINHQKAENSK
jgi:hypothetical protein